MNNQNQYQENTNKTKDIFICHLNEVDQSHADTEIQISNDAIESIAHPSKIPYRKRKPKIKTKCINCNKVKRSQLIRCILCPLQKCKSCIKNEKHPFSTKKIRNPELYVCSMCMQEPTATRFKHQNIGDDSKMMIKPEDIPQKQRKDFGKNIAQASCAWNSSKNKRYSLKSKKKSLRKTMNCKKNNRNQGNEDFEKNFASPDVFLNTNINDNISVQTVKFITDNSSKLSCSVNNIKCKQEMGSSKRHCNSFSLTTSIIDQDQDLANSNHNLIISDESIVNEKVSNLQQNNQTMPMCCSMNQNQTQNFFNPYTIEKDNTCLCPHCKDYTLKRFSMSFEAYNRMQFQSIPFDSSILNYYSNQQSYNIPQVMSYPYYFLTNSNQYLMGIPSQFNAQEHQNYFP